jgi:hypothetical protein
MRTTRIGFVALLVALPSTSCGRSQIFPPTATSSSSATSSSTWMSASGGSSTSRGTSAGSSTGGLPGLGQRCNSQGCAVTDSGVPLECFPYWGPGDGLCFQSCGQSTVPTPCTLTATFPRRAGPRRRASSRMPASTYRTAPSKWPALRSATILRTPRLEAPNARWAGSASRTSARISATEASEGARARPGLLPPLQDDNGRPRDSRSAALPQSSRAPGNFRPPGALPLLHAACPATFRSAWCSGCCSRSARC